jgi:hypothetical protein
MATPRRDAGFRSTAFTPKDGKGARYLLDAIPLALWRSFRAHCRRQKVSARTRLLQMVQADVEAAKEFERSALVEGRTEKQEETQCSQDSA